MRSARAGDRSDVDIGCRQKLYELLLTDEPVVEDHVAVDTKALCAVLEHQSVGLSVAFNDVRMRHTEDDVHRLWILRADRWQRIDDVLNPFVRRQQSERQNHRLPFDTQSMLAATRRRHRRNAVWDQINLAAADVVDLTEQVRGMLAHDDEPFREPQQLVENGPFCRARLGEDRVQRRHDGHATAGAGASARRCARWSGALAFPHRHAQSVVRRIDHVDLY
jgi:hypothetical protein